MARVEKNLELNQEVEELRQEVVDTEKQVKKNSRGGKWFLSCGAIFLILFLILAIAIVWFLSATGLITVPVVSSFVYKEPQPIHKVETGVPLDVLVTENLNSLLTERLQSGGGNLSDRSVELFLPESSMTTSLRSLAGESDLALIKLQDLQVAVEPEIGVEIFAPMANWHNNNAIRVLFVPGIENGVIILENLNLSLGNFTFPGWLTNLLVKPIVERALVSLNQKLGGYVSLDKIELSNKNLEVSGSLVVEIMKF